MKRASLIQFFATRTDLEAGFRALEKCSFKLVCIDDYYQTKAIPVIESLLAIPNLGKVTGRRSQSYLAMRETPQCSRVVQIGRRRDFPQQIAVALAMVKIRPPGGKVVYEVNQASNPASIVFAPGGFLNEKMLLAGKIETMWDNETSMGLFNLFRGEILRGFTSVKSFEVGPEGLVFLKSGGRLTIDAQASSSLDLALT